MEESSSHAPSLADATHGSSSDYLRRASYNIKGGEDHRSQESLPVGPPETKDACTQVSLSPLETAQERVARRELKARRRAWDKAEEVSTPDVASNRAATDTTTTVGAQLYEPPPVYRHCDDWDEVDEYFTAIEDWRCRTKTSETLLVFRMRLAVPAAVAKKIRGVHQWEEMRRIIAEYATREVNGEEESEDEPEHTRFRKDWLATFPEQDK